jgi:hypothetical protein
MRLLFILLLASLAPGASARSPDVLPGDSAPWPRHAIDDTSRGADGVKLGDFNRDGLTDLVTGWEEGGVVRAYAHPGPAAVKTPWPRVTVGRVKDVEEALFADLDGDGRLDVVSGTEGKNRTLYWHRAPSQDLMNPAGWTTRAFPATAGARMWMQALALDLDGRHGQDLLLASKGPGAAIAWLRHPGVPRALDAWTCHDLRPAAWIMSLLPHDLDGDADPDVLFTDRKGSRSGIFWLENPGPARVQDHAPWTEHPVGALGREVMFADIGDIDGDGLADIAAAAKPRDVFLFFRQPGGGWRELTLSLLSTSIGDAKAVKIGDLNQDGLADLVFTCENAAKEREGVVWLEQRRGGSWLQHSLGGPEGVKFDLVQLLDLDADGDLDVITCEERDQLGLIWYENPAPPSR